MTKRKKHLVLVVIGLCILLLPVLWKLNKNDGDSIYASGDSGGKIVSFLQQKGWQVSDESAEISEITIPYEFGNVYDNYNKIQIQQGFDLRKFKSKTVKKYTYKIENYPSETGGMEENVVANVLVYEGEIIGGDICSLELGGFIHGFTKEKS